MTVFLISDTHFNHKNIIKYCNRPFRSTQEMDSELIKNWNSVVKKTDTVFFLGDFSLGHEVAYFMKLNGHVFFIKGNHDQEQVAGNQTYDNLILPYGDEQFYLVHSPKDIPEEFDGWAITGHVHNNYGEFINPDVMNVNVSVEMIDYTPIPLAEIAKKIHEKGF